MNRIVIEAVAPQEMRPQYQDPDGCGDWYRDRNGDLVVRVSTSSDLDDPLTFLFAVHELVEAKLCLARGIAQEEIDAFDAAFIGDGEPGDDTAAPYRREHRQACLVEFLLADMLNIDGYGVME